MLTSMEQNEPIHVGIVADDLTSATDGAAPFLAKGYAPLIHRSLEDQRNGPVVAIDATSRNLTPAQAAQVTAAAIAALNNPAILFKTIDSTLRGHIREEIEAAFLASGRNRLVIAPAFPDAGRLTVDGIQTVNGVPVDQSSYGRDPVHPARTSHITDLVAPSIGQPVILGKTLSESEAGKIGNESVVILDADNQEALNRRVARIPAPSNVLWVGSPGLAIALAALVPAVPAQGADANETGRRVLVVAGSANPVTHMQCDALETQGVPVVGHVGDASTDSPVLCLRAPQQRRQNADAVLTDLAGQAATVIARHDYDTVIATGGETMAAVLDQLGITRFVLTREQEPGFPVGRAIMTDGATLMVAMKAGGFGLPSTLLRAATSLSGQSFSGKVTTDAHQ